MATPPDRTFAAVVRLKGAEDAEFYRCIQSITVTEDLDQGSSFQIRLALLRDEEGAWPHIDDERLEPWNRITIIAAFPDGEDVIMDGYISHIDSGTNPEAGAMIGIRGVDAAYALNLEEKCKVWQEMTYEQIAEEIINSYGLTPVLPAETGSESADSSGPPPSVVQRATDFRFLRELARRKGYEFFVRGGNAYFRPADLSGPPQKLIAIRFGEQTNCENLHIEVDATRPTVAVMRRIDPLTGESQEVTSESSGLDPLGQTDLSEMRGFGAPQTRVFVRQQGAGSEAQMTDYVSGLLRRNGWWVKASGTLKGLRYGRVLRSRRTVTVKGLGTKHNGEYYVRKVVHKLTAQTYEMDFEAVRNRLQQTGDEDLQGEISSAAPIPVAAGAGADSEAIQVAEGGNVVAPA